MARRGPRVHTINMKKKKSKALIFGLIQTVEREREGEREREKSDLLSSIHGISSVGSR